MFRASIAATAALFLSACAGEEPAAPARPATPAEAEALVRQIEERRNLRIERWDELDGRIRDRNALIDRLVAMGEPGAIAVRDFLRPRVHDLYVRSLWLFQTFLRFQGAVVDEFMEEFLAHPPPMDADEWRTLAYHLRGQSGEWALRQAIRMTKSADEVTRSNGVQALMDWQREEANAAVLERLRSDPSNLVRLHAAEFARRPCFGRSLGELRALVAALDDPEGPAVAAENSLDAIVDPAITPPRVRVPVGGASPEAIDGAIEQRRRAWKPWLDANADRLEWSPSAQRFVLAAGR